jgi:hypothetical protein
MELNNFIKKFAEQFDNTDAGEFKADTGKIKKDDKIIASGFGAGLSWGTAYVQVKDCDISPLVEY